MTQQKRRPVQFATYVDPDMAERLDQQAASANMSRAEYLRRVLERWLESVEGGGDTSLESRESQLANREVLNALKDISQGLTALPNITQKITELNENVARLEENRSWKQILRDAFLRRSG